NRIAGRLSNWAVETDELLIDELEKLLGIKITAEQPSLKLLQKARKLFAVLLDTPGGIKIQTIHSFCQEILKRFPLEAKISPYFEVMDDRSSQEMLTTIKNSILQSPPSPEVKDALALLTSTVSEYQFPDILKTITEQRNSIESILKKYPSFTDFINFLASTLKIDASETVENLEQNFWRNLPLDEIKILINALEAGTETSKKNAAKLSAAIKAENLEDYIPIFLTKDLTLQSKLLVKNSLSAFPQSQTIAKTEADRIITFINNKTAADLLAHTKAVLTLAEEMLSLYRKHKKAQSKMDYNDLIILTKTLLETPKIADWILYKLDGGIDNILIDEAQDTSPEQWSIIKSLTSEFFTGLGRHEKQPTIFVVGDRKQSIYSFQGADPQEFEKMHNYFSNKAPDFQTVKMDVSFRSTAAVLDAVNQVFTNPQACRGLTTDPATITHTPARIGDGGQVEFWPVIEPEADTDDDGTWKLPIEKLNIQSPSSKLATKIAETIKEKVSKGEILQSQGRPLRYKDFLILVQRRNSFVEEIVRACKNIGVAITGVDK
ncbi:MAG: UvrD-helicase domain-containing protein, partial [Alphaproteobacteria bacterium]|nr:UvrD-helicase domain-containing protein [Alphaproteobacteria bacterium]